jgi:hypothetical protein
LPQRILKNINGGYLYAFLGYGYVELAGFATTITTPMQIEYGYSFDTEVERGTSFGGIDPEDHNVTCLCDDQQLCRDLLEDFSCLDAQEVMARAKSRRQPIATKSPPSAPKCGTTFTGAATDLDDWALYHGLL